MRKKKTGMVKYGKYGYIFSLPFAIAFLVFQLYPILFTAFIGFTDLKGVVPGEIHILENPFENFQQVLTNPVFQGALGNTFLIWLCNFIPQLSLALLLTAWFTDRRWKLKGQGIYKVLIYMPNIITAATIAILFKSLFDYPVSPVNDILVKVGILKEAHNFLIGKGMARGLVAFIQFWQWYGYTMVMLIAGVIGINPEIFEAADLDGANRVQTFFLITLPCIRTIMLYVLVTSLIGGLNMFDIPSLYAQDKGDNGGYTVNMYIKDQAFAGAYRYNTAAAASVIMFIVIVLLSLVLFYIMRDKDEAKLKKLKKQQLKMAKSRKAY